MVSTASSMRAPSPSSCRNRVHWFRGAGRRRAVHLCRRVLHAWWFAPPAIRLLAGVSLILATWLVVNWVYQTIRKPTELFFPVSGSLVKTPQETWQQYGSLFSRHSTAVITPEFLAALAQI